MANKFEGIVKQSVLRIKPYVPGKPIEEVQRELGLKEVIKLASNENPLGPSIKAVKAATAAVKKVSLYPDSSSFYLKKALSKKLKIKPEQIMIGNGSNELEQLIAEAFVEQGDEVMFSEASFVVYQIVTDLTGGSAVVVPHKNFGHDMEGFANQLTEKTKIVFLCNPNNPTGTIISTTELEKFLARVPAKTIVILDEAYFEYVKDKNYPDGLKYLAKYPNLIVLRTFSKIYGLAGLRIGYGVADPDMVRIIETVRAPFNVNMVAQAAAVAALTDKAHVAKTKKTNEAGKKYLYAELDKLGIDYVPTQANFIYMKLKSKGGELFAALLKKGVIIRPQHGNYARVTIGTMAENVKFIKALKSIV